MEATMYNSGFVLIGENHQVERSTKGQHSAAEIFKGHH